MRLFTLLAALATTAGTATAQDQAAVEAGDSLPFEQYRQQYVSAERLGRPSQKAA